MISWVLKRLPELSGPEVHDLLALRCEVFVVEQACAYQDPDPADHHATHLLGRDGQGALVAVLRIVDPGVKYPEPSLGRVISAPRVRGSGVGRAVVAEGLRRCAQLWPGRSVRISAQARLERFYADFGFQGVGDPYLEDGIPHLEMLRPPSKEIP